MLRLPATSTGVAGPVFAFRPLHTTAIKLILAYSGLFDHRLRTGRQKPLRIAKIMLDENFSIYNEWRCRQSSYLTNVFNLCVCVCLADWLAVCHRWRKCGSLQGNILLARKLFGSVSSDRPRQAGDAHTLPLTFKNLDCCSPALHHGANLELIIVAQTQNWSSSDRTVGTS